MRLPPRMEYRASPARATLLADGRVWASWDPAEHPGWPPVDSDGHLIGDVPWKFLDPEE